MVESKSPGLLSLVNGALNEIFKPETPFLTASVYDILFGGIVINCTTDDFKAQTLCTKLKTESEDLEIVSDSIFKFSLFGPVSYNICSTKPQSSLNISNSLQLLTLAFVEASLLITTKLIHRKQLWYTNLVPYFFRVVYCKLIVT